MVPSTQSSYTFLPTAADPSGFTAAPAATNRGSRCSWGRWARRACGAAVMMVDRSSARRAGSGTLTASVTHVCAQGTQRVQQVHEVPGVSLVEVHGTGVY